MIDVGFGCTSVPGLLSLSGGSIIIHGIIHVIVASLGIWGWGFSA
jgi:hypothetical protein